MPTIPSILAVGIPSIQWPLSTLPPPMEYQSLSALKELRRKQIIDDHPLAPVILHLPEMLEMWFPSSTSSTSAWSQTNRDHHKDDAKYFGWISTALIVLGNGYVDECHDLVTPLSWPDDLHFAHGASRYDQVSPAVQVYATAVHSLVHRREAASVGEFGMMGFANAAYWSSATRQCAGYPLLPHAELRQAVIKLSQQDPFQACPPVQAWCQQHGFAAQTDYEVDDSGRRYEGGSTEASTRLSPEAYYNSRAVHDLCAAALRAQLAANEKEEKETKTSTTGISVDSVEVLRFFAEQVAASEVRILLQHTLPRAGWSGSSIIY